MDSRYLLTNNDDSSQLYTSNTYTRQELNNMVLSKINLPSYLMDNIKLIRTEQDKIASLRDTIDRCDAISQATIFTIDNFISQIKSLEQVLTPMHDETHNIIAAQRNIDLSLREVHHIMDNLDVIQKKPGVDPFGPQSQTISERLHNDYREFTHYMFQLLESHRYWTIHSHFAGSDRIIKRLNDLISQSVTECDAEFEKILAMSSKPIDVFRLGWPLPSKFEWLADTVTERLSYIAQALIQAKTAAGAASESVNKAIQYKPLEFLAQYRSPFLKSTFKLLAQNYTSNTTGGRSGGTNTTNNDRSRSNNALATNKSILSPQHQNIPGTGTNPDDNEQIGRYQKGTHYIVFLSTVLIGILELEFQTWNNILSLADDLEQEEIDNCFGTAITPTLQSFAKRVTEALTLPSSNKLLYTLDILGHLQQLQPRFRAVLKRGLDQQDSFLIFSQIKAQITDQIQNILLEHIINRVKVSKFDKKTRLDGSVSDVTVETVTFLRALCTYDDVLDLLPVQVAYTATTKPFITDHSQITSKDGSKVKIPTADEVLTLNNRLMVDAREKFKAKHSSSNDTERFVWKTVLPLSILPGLAGTNGFCTVSQGVVWDILQGLDATLQVRSDALKRSDLSWLFYLNNYHHIAQTASRHHFRVHPLFLTYYVNKTERAKMLYQTNTFKKLLTFLDIDNYDKMLEAPDKKTGGLQKSFCKLIKARFDGFNTTFRELYSTQRKFSVPDSDLRGQLRSESIDIVVPLYEKFLAKFMDLPFSDKKDKYVLYRADFIEGSLNKFFDELA